MKFQYSFAIHNGSSIIKKISTFSRRYLFYSWNMCLFNTAFVDRLRSLRLPANYSTGGRSAI